MKHCYPHRGKTGRQCGFNPYSFGHMKTLLAMPCVALLAVPSMVREREEGKAERANERGFHLGAPRVLDDLAD